MAPIHHHFELKGWEEPKVIVRFWIITFLLVLCSSSNDSTDVVESTTTLAQVNNDSQDSTTTTVNTSSTSVVESYVYDKEKMSPFTGLEISNELWLKRPRRVIAFKIDNNYVINGLCHYQNLNKIYGQRKSYS